MKSSYTQKIPLKKKFEKKRKNPIIPGKFQKSEISEKFQKKKKFKNFQKSEKSEIFFKNSKNPKIFQKI